MMSHDEHLSLVGKRIAQGRAELHLTQKSLAKHLGVSWEMVSRYERGVSNPMPHLFRIASFLKKPVRYFVEESQAIEGPVIPTQVGESLSPNILEKLFVPLLVSPAEYKSWRKSGVFTGVYQAPLWMHQYGPIWVTSLAYCEIKTPQVQGNGMLFVSSQPDNDPVLSITLGTEKFLVSTTDSAVNNSIGYVLAWEKRFV